MLVTTPLGVVLMEPGDNCLRGAVSCEGDEHVMMFKIHFVYSDPLADRQPQLERRNVEHIWNVDTVQTSDDDTLVGIWWAAQTVRHSHPLTIIRSEARRHIVPGLATVSDPWLVTTPWWWSVSKHSQLMPCVTMDYGGNPMRNIHGIWNVKLRVDLETSSDSWIIIMLNQKQINQFANLTKEYFMGEDFIHIFWILDI